MDRSKLPENAFVDPSGGNRAAAARFAERALSRVLDVLASGAERPPLRRAPEIPSASLPERGREESAILDDLEAMLRASMNPGHPAWVGHMDPLPAWASVIGDLAAAAMNNNMLSAELSPVFTRLEHELVRELAGAFGLGPDASGVLTGGGSIANLTALAVARNDAFDIVEHGLAGLARPPVLFASEVAHTSLQKAAMILGLGRSALVGVPVDERFRMRPDALLAAINAARRDGKAPFAIVATCGTTTTGSIDPVPEIAEIARAEELWLHVDAAYGGAAVFSHSLRGRLAGIASADSVTFNPQKWAYVTKTCAAVLFRETDRWHRAFRTALPYMLAPESGVNLGEVGVHGTRHPDAVKLWATMQHLGREGLEQLVDESCALAAYLANGISRRRNLRLATRPELNIVCFRGEPRTMGSESWDAWNRGLHRELLDRAEVFFSLPNHCGERWLKAVVLNPYADESVVDDWLDSIDRYVMRTGGFGEGLETPRVEGAGG